MAMRIFGVAKSALGWLDRGMERGIRSVAQTHGRRSFLTRLGTAVVGGVFLPMLPYDRSLGADKAAASSSDDATQCEYWANCALNGTLCNACGGSPTQCPPGSKPSVVSWIGTCTNPNDRKAYLVAYNDCCGKSDCDAPEETFCSHNEGERPGYRIGAYNDVNWCMANPNLGSHCTTAVIVGTAEDH
jgi:methylamine dehydrogenase light chain